MDMLAVPTSSALATDVPRKNPSLPQKFDIATPSVLPSPLHAIAAPSETPTSTRVAVASELLTWSQIPPARRQGGNIADMSLRNPSSLRRPAPSHYMIGDPLTRMHEPDPTRAEVDAFARLVRTAEWKEMRKDLDKWAGSRTGATFEAKGNPSAVTNWDNMMSTYFSENVILNSVVQARLATQTFRGQALNWWRAHSQLVPELVVSYEQLLEWIRTELVPLADPATATLSWRQLRSWVTWTTIFVNLIN